MKGNVRQRDKISFHRPLYAIWAETAKTGPLSGQCGYLTEDGKALIYSEKAAADQKLHDIQKLCVNRSPVAAYQVCEMQQTDSATCSLPLEAIKKYDLIPDFEPTDYTVKEKGYGNTGGGCMVGTVQFYLPSLDKRVWVNCDDSGVTVTSADYIWNEDQSGSWERYEDVLLFNADFRTVRPEDIGAWLPMVRETLAYTIEQQTGQYGRSFCLPVEWLPDGYSKCANQNYLIWAQSNCEDVTSSSGGQISPSERYLQEWQRTAGGKALIYVASPYAGDTAHNIEFAKQACRAVMDSGHAFFAPHLLYPSVLDDNAPEQREFGMEMGISVLSRCDELWVFGDRISTGMRAEIDAAERMGIPIQYVTLSMEQELPGSEMQTLC